MKPGARVAAVIELLQSIISSSSRINHADTVVRGYLRSRRYIGSHDRRWITEHLWGIIRQKLRLEWWIERYQPNKNNPVDAKKLAITYWVLNRKEIDSGNSN